MGFIRAETFMLAKRGTRACGHHPRPGGERLGTDRDDSLSFAVGAGGYNPVASLVFDAVGNLYGTTSEGGDFSSCSVGCGVAFQLSPSGSGWSESVLYPFAGNRDGANPFVDLVADAAGNLYGATGNGGVSKAGTI